MSIVAKYNFRSSSFLTDSIGGYNLSNINNVSQYEGGINMGSADFGTSNTNKRLTINNSIGLVENQTKTLELWVRMNTYIATGSYTLINLAAGAALEIQYEYNNGNRRLIFRRYGSSESDSYYYITIPVNTWNHIALTYNYSVSLVGYYNGVRVAGHVPATTSGIQGNYFTLGATYNGALYNPASCAVSNVTVYNHELSPSEIKNNYAYNKGFF
jgi:hypothetical protein